MSSSLRFGFGFDVRNPTAWYKPFPDLYAETLEFIAWTENLGFENCWFAEHHGIDDGYLPSPLMMGAAVAAKTKAMRIGTGVGLLPHYHPVRFAEDTAVLDNISNGRVELSMGIGYLKFECEAYGIESKTRGSRSDEILEIVRRLWKGETVTHKGEFYDIRKARIFPPSSPKTWNSHVHRCRGASRPETRRAAGRWLRRAIGELGRLRRSGESVRETRIDGAHHIARCRGYVVCRVR